MRKRSRGIYMARSLLQHEAGSRSNLHQNSRFGESIVPSQSRQYSKVRKRYSRQNSRTSRTYTRRLRRRSSRLLGTDPEPLPVNISTRSDDAAKGSSDSQPRPPTVIELLIGDEANKPIWDAFMKNRFCQDGYKNRAQDFDAKFLTFAKQDYLYLLDYIRFKSFREFKNQDVIQNFDRLHKASRRITSDVNFANDYYNLCLDMGATEDEMDNLIPSHAQLAYSNWMQLNALTNDYISAYIMMIPCIYGWYQIAKQLQSTDTRSDENSLFVRHWHRETIEKGGAYAEALSETIENLRYKYNIMENAERWSKLLREACQMELEFFNVAYRESSF